MAEALLTSTQVANQGAFRVVAPFMGDSVSGALNSAFGEQDDLPPDWCRLLNSLDEID
ncbi:hypothetical protein [Sphingomonas sp. Leaf357]|uniref:hypothetical protein n=1 Tax=Sphingomonas sp. Leaf357 TaxID=1736350 RepID=UPI0012E19944|nr:hypothetical protein [Sphingomonas sp. Leaf357]